MNKKITALLIVLVSSTSLFSQTKTNMFIGTYDSALVGFKSEIHFTNSKDKKKLSFDETGQDQNSKITREFWNQVISNTYTVNGITFENHTNQNNKGKTYEIEYESTQVSGEDGVSITNIIKTFAIYDSSYIAFKKEYAVWDLNNSKQDKLNMAPANPKSVTKQYLEAVKIVDIEKMKTMYATEEYLTKINEETNGRCLKTCKLTQADINDKNKREFSKLYSLLTDEKNGEKQPTPDFVDYLTPTRALVGYGITKNKIYCFVLDKIKGQWKIIDFDDKLLIPISGKELELRKKMINKKTNLELR